MANEPGAKPVPLVWDEAEDLPVVLANEALGLVGSYGEVLLTLGQSTPPVLLGDEEERRRRFEEISEVHVKPLAGKE